jgi:hypothetical protein
MSVSLRNVLYTANSVLCLGFCQLLELKLAEESKGWSGELRHEVLAILAHAWPQ